MTPSSIQLDADGRLRHFLTVEGLKRRHLVEILDRAEALSGVAERRMTKSPTLHGKTVVNLFFENSTRTRTTFELAAKRLSADVLNVNISTSSTHKGETLLDTIRNIEAMQVDMFVVRHAVSGAAEFIARHVAPHIAVLPASGAITCAACSDTRTACATSGRFPTVDAANTRSAGASSIDGWTRYAPSSTHRRTPSTSAPTTSGAAIASAPTAAASAPAHAGTLGTRAIASDRSAPATPLASCTR